jgi:hypothetical protein
VGYTTVRSVGGSISLRFYILGKEDPALMKMSEQQIRMCEKLKRLGYGQNSQIRLYGDMFDLTSDPLVITDQLVVVDAIEQKTGRARRIRIPLNVLNIANQEQRVA